MDRAAPSEPRVHGPAGDVLRLLWVAAAPAPGGDPEQLAGYLDVEVEASGSWGQQRQNVRLPLSPGQVRRLAVQLLNLCQPDVRDAILRLPWGSFGG